MEMYLTFRRCNQHLLESSWFPPWRSLLLPPFFIWLPPPPTHTPPSFLPYICFFHVPLPVLLSYLRLPPSLSILIWGVWASRKGGLICLSVFFLSFIIRAVGLIPVWYRGKSCKTANRRTDAALVGVSRLGRDHNRIYMVMKSEKLVLVWAASLRGAAEDRSAFTPTSVAAAVLNVTGCHPTVAFISLFMSKTLLGCCG